jgi:hypothetical protein
MNGFVCHEIVFTTISMPKETEWKEQSLLDPDVAYLIQKIKANEVVSYVTLDN